MYLWGTSVPITGSIHGLMKWNRVQAEMKPWNLIDYLSIVCLRFYVAAQVVWAVFSLVYFQFLNLRAFSEQFLFECDYDPPSAALY